MSNVSQLKVANKAIKQNISNVLNTIEKLIIQANCGVILQIQKTVFIRLINQFSIHNVIIIIYYNNYIILFMTKEHNRKSSYYFYT